MKITNKYDLPDVFVKAVENYDNSYDVTDPNEISATTLIDSHYIRYLRNQYSDIIEVDVVDRFYALRGSMVHEILEKAGDSSLVQELRLSTMVNGVKISGKCDLWYPAERKLQDYKVLKANAYQWFMDLGYKPEWERQLNVLRYIWQKNGFTIDKLEIIAIFIELTEFEKKKHNYPDKNVMTINIPIWSDLKLQEYVQERVYLHSIPEPPYCNVDERWGKEDKWAVKKAGSDRAVNGGIFLSAHEAMEFLQTKGNGYEIEFRKGEDTRCGYCDYKSVCGYHK